MARTFLSVFLPNFSIELLKRNLYRYRQKFQEFYGEDDSALAPADGFILTASVRRRDIVVRCCDIARERGVRVGMSAADGKSFAPNAYIQPLAPRAEYETLTQLARWAYRFSPLCAVESAGSTQEYSEYDPRWSGFSLDITGSERLFGGYPQLVSKIKQGLAQLGFSARIAGAPTAGAAWALSRYGSDLLTSDWIVPRETLVETLSPLPVSALRLTRSVTDSLRELNVNSIGELLSLSRVSLLERFGSDVLKRLDQALGTSEERLEVVRPKRTLVVERNFDSPIEDRTTLGAVVETLLDELLGHLARVQKRTWSLALQCKDTKGIISAQTITLTIPSQDRTHLWKLLSPHIERLPLSQPLATVALIAARTTNITAVPTTCISDENNTFDQDSAQLVDRLQEQLGHEAVCRLRTFASHIPEKSFAFEPLHSKVTSSSTPTVPAVERPSLLFKPPQLLRVMAVVPDNPPFAITWKEHSYKVLKGQGPERIAPEWWKDDSPRDKNTRDYFRIQLETGTWLWVYRELETRDWFLHGIWS